MSEIGSYQAKTHLAELLDRVDHGEQFTITRHGRAIAELRPVIQEPKRDLAELIARAADLRAAVASAGASLAADEIRAAIAEGRR